MAQAKLKVVLLRATPDPDDLVALGARLCYAQADIDALKEKVESADQRAFVERVMQRGHLSVTEHAAFTFAVEGVSRALLAQLTRHRIASFSVQSQRYVKEKQFSFVTPPQIAQDPQAAVLYQQAMQYAHASYLELSERLAQKNLEQLLAEGVDEKKARSMAEKRAIEDARRFQTPDPDL